MIYLHRVSWRLACSNRKSVAEHLNICVFNWIYYKFRLENWYWKFIWCFRPDAGKFISRTRYDTVSGLYSTTTFATVRTNQTNFACYLNINGTDYQRTTNNSANGKRLTDLVTLNFFLKIWSNLTNFSGSFLSSQMSILSLTHNPQLVPCNSVDYRYYSYFMRLDPAYTPNTRRIFQRSKLKRISKSQPNKRRSFTMNWNKNYSSGLNKYKE